MRHDRVSAHQWLRERLVDADLGEQAVDLDRLELAHPAGAGDGLPFDGGLELGFADDHDRRRLDVEADAAGDDLGDQHRAVAGFPAAVTFALTGTPLENSLSDLWALLQITSPGLFPSPRRFREEYVQPIEKGKVPENAELSPYRAARIARLRRRIRPFLLRRTKERVAAELPPKQEQNLHVELSPAHRARYDTVLQRERQKVLGMLGDMERNRFEIFRSLTLLRQASLDIGLIDPDHANGTHYLQHGALLRSS